MTLTKVLTPRNGLPDVNDEEPTTLAEDLHERFPNDWLLNVLDSTQFASEHCLMDGCVVLMLLGWC